MLKGRGMDIAAMITLGRSYFAALTLVGIMGTMHPSRVYGASPPAAKHKSASKLVTPTQTSSINRQFNEGLALYNKGQYQEALIAFDNILKRHPQHNPSLIMYARSLYKVERYRDSYTVFVRTNPAELDADTSYEYAYSFYVAASYEGALFAFKRVPKGHALYDLANYYGGIAAMKLRRFPDAEDMLEKAVILPEKLAQSRNLYLKHIQSIRLMQEKQSLANDRDAERKRLEGEKSKPADDGKAKPKKDETKPVAAVEGAYVHKGFYGVPRAAEVGYSYSDQLVDYQGLIESTAKSAVGFMTLSHGPMIPLPLKRDSSSAAFGMPFTLGLELNNTEGQEKRNYVTDTDKDVVRVESSDPTRSYDKSGYVDFAPWLEIPLPGDLWIGTSFDLYFNYADFERSGRSGSRKYTLNLGGFRGSFTILTEGSFMEVVNTKTEVVSNRFRSQMSLSSKTPYDLTVSMVLRHDLFHYKVEELSGPDTSSQITVALLQALPIGFAFELQGSYEYINNYLFGGSPTLASANADGQGMGGKMSLLATPAPWIRGGISQSLGKTTWKSSQQQFQDIIDQVVPSYQSKFNAEAALVFAF